MTGSPEIRPAEEAEFEIVMALLEGLDLPSAGLHAGMPNLLVAVVDGRIQGCAALEVSGRSGLLRSLAVDPSAQGTGMGTTLTKAVESHASDLGLDEVFLLTTTAAQFFPRFGFEIVDGSELPTVVTGSSEYSTCIAQQATIMRKKL